MNKTCVFLFFLFLLSIKSYAQFFPREGDTLNYRIIGFNVPMKGHKCTLEIASGNISQADSFLKNRILSIGSVENRVIAEVPAFGKEYTWRIVDKENKEAASVLHHFRTGIMFGVDTEVTRFRVFRKAEAHKDAYVFLDGTRALYDMNGRAVWFLPNFEHFPNEEYEVRNLNITPQGTITFIVGEKAYEVDYNASVLWRAPDNSNGGGSFFYHHQLTRMSNGHYMILGNEMVVCKRPLSPDSSFVISSSAEAGPGGSPVNIAFGTLLEFDDHGLLVWSWKSSSYFKQSDIIYHKTAGGIPKILAHQNGFYFDEKTNNIYVSFRDISRILKVKYPQGDVENVYGEIFKAGVPEQGNGLFCHQHSCKISDKGYLYLFNNNLCNSGGLPTILLMQEPGTKGGKLRKVWEYQCTIDGIAEDARQPSYQFTTGGNVTELSDHSIFASMSAPFYTKVFIVDERKKTLWSAMPERLNPATKKWEMMNLYQANIIGPKEMEKLIWSTQTR